MFKPTHSSDLVHSLSEPESGSPKTPSSGFFSLELLKHGNGLFVWLSTAPA